MSEVGGLDWLENRKTWAQVTREERFFCAELFFVIRQDVRRFVEFLNASARTSRVRKWAKLDPEVAWEPAYEACFYRDLKHDSRRIWVMGEESRSLLKRTFDLALFSSEAIILIEAKSHQGFDNKQLESIDDDRKNVARWTHKTDGRSPKFLVVGLASSKYTPKSETRNHFDLMVAWNDLACLYGDDDRARRLFCRANDIYGD